MKREALLIAVLLLVATAHVYAVDEADLLIVDDFEEGPQDWSVAARGVAAMQYIIDEEEYISGEKSARFEIANTGGGDWSA